MQHELLRQDLVQLDWEVTDQHEFFQRMVDKLLDRGYVKDTFLEAIEQRERLYPTALPTLPEAIAIPHSDVEHIIRPFIAPTRLLHPVTWHEMGNDSVTHPVRLIFVLGFVKEDGHVEVLQALLQNLQQPGSMTALFTASSPEELFRAVSTAVGPTD